MAGAQLSRNEVVQMIIRVSLVSVATYFSVKWMISQIGRHKTSAHILFPTIKKNNYFQIQLVKIKKNQRKRLKPC